MGICRGEDLQKYSGSAIILVENGVWVKLLFNQSRTHLLRLNSREYGKGYCLYSKRVKLYFMVESVYCAENAMHEGVLKCPEKS